jgi:hypothetical protein
VIHETLGQTNSVAGVEFMHLLSTPRTYSTPLYQSRVGEVSWGGRGYMNTFEMSECPFQLVADNHFSMNPRLLSIGDLFQTIRTIHVLKDVVKL